MISVFQENLMSSLIDNILEGMDWVSVIPSEKEDSTTIIFDWCLHDEGNNRDKVIDAVFLLNKVYVEFRKSLRFELYEIDKRDKPYVGIKMVIEGETPERLQQQLPVIVTNVKSLLKVIGYQI